MSDASSVDSAALRAEVKKKYRDVALKPSDTYHFHTGRRLAARLGYDGQVVDAMPEAAVESFAGVANPFSLRDLKPGERLIDLGSGAGFDCFIAASKVGPTGRVIGVDMTQEMLDKSRCTAEMMQLGNLEFRDGILEALPIEDGWADVVISNGVINLCADKRQVFAEIDRVLRPGGYLQFADIANGKPVPAAAAANIELWTAWIAGGLPCAAWQKMLEDSGFEEVRIGPPVATFAGAKGEPNARRFEVFGYAFIARKPG